MDIKLGNAVEEEEAPLASSDACDRAICCACVTSCGSAFSLGAYAISLQSSHSSQCDRSCAPCGVYHGVGSWNDAVHGRQEVVHGFCPACHSPLSLDQHDGPMTLLRGVISCDGAPGVGDSPAP